MLPELPILGPLFVAWMKKRRISCAVYWKFYQSNPCPIKRNLALRKNSEDANGEERKTGGRQARTTGKQRDETDSTYSTFSSADP